MCIYIQIYINDRHACECIDLKCVVKVYFLYIHINFTSVSLPRFFYDQSTGLKENPMDIKMHVLVSPMKKDVMTTRMFFSMGLFG